VPARTADSGGTKQQQYGFSGQAALVTGPKAGTSVAAQDLDGGVTSVLSPTARLGNSGTSGWRLQFRYAFGHNASATADDYVRVLVNGTEVFAERGSGANRNAQWQVVQVGLDAFAGQQVRVRIEAADGAADSLVEVAVDDVRIFREQ
jgi:aminopeptidase S